MTAHTSLTGMRAAQTDLNVIANNVANVNSTGFKKSRAMFADLFAAAPLQNTRTVAGIGTQLLGVAQNFAQGTINVTDRTLDLAITGDGMFVTKYPAGAVTYTRNGAFNPDASGRVMDPLGHVLQVVDGQGTMQDLVIPQERNGVPLASLSVGKDGTVTGTWADGTDSVFGRVAMATFANENGLRPLGDSHWITTGDSGPAQIGPAASGARGSIQSGALELANVDITEELVALIAAQRNFQANAKAIETDNAMTMAVINLRS